VAWAEWVACLAWAECPTKNKTPFFLFFYFLKTTYLFLENLTNLRFPGLINENPLICSSCPFFVIKYLPSSVLPTNPPFSMISSTAPNSKMPVADFSSKALSFLNVLSIFALALTIMPSVSIVPMCLFPLFR
jgi:hypothetical protein